MTKLRVIEAFCSASCFRNLLLAVAVLCSSHAAAFTCDNQELEDADQYYCGNDRGSYVLQPGGVSLWVSAKRDGQPIVKVREKTPQDGLMERILLQFGDVIGDEIVTGVGSNPHINARGEAAVQVTASASEFSSVIEKVTEWWHAAAIPSQVGLFVSSPGQTPTLVAAAGAQLGADTAICGEGIQPWPYVGNSGHYVFGATLTDALGHCGPPDWGDAEARGNINPCEDAATSLAHPSTRARITRFVVAPGDWSNTNSNQSRYVTVHYELLDGQTISPGDNLGVRLPQYLIDPSRTAENQCTGSRNVTWVKNDWDHSVSGQISTVMNNAWEMRTVCSLDGCDVDVSDFNFFVYNGTPIVSSGHNASGVRAIARGKVGEAGPETIVRAVTMPRSAEESETVVLALEPDHPAAQSGEVTYRLRRASAITHSARMVGEDGSVVLSAGAQAAPEKLVFGADDLHLSDLQQGYWHQMLLHVDPAGAISVAANTRGDLKHFSNAQVTSDGGVIYRSYHDSNDDDVNYAANRRIFVTGWSSGLPTGNVPTGAGAARPGTWYPDGVSIINTTTNANYYSTNCARDARCSLTVTSSAPGAGDWSMWVSSGLISGSSADAVTAAAAAGELGLMVSVKKIYESMVMTDEADAASGDTVVFSLPTDVITQLGGTADTGFVYKWPLELNKWTKAGGVSTVFSNGDVSPAGFSLIAGVPKHFSEGGGVIGARVRLETPYVGSSGGVNANPYSPYDASSEASMLETILGDDYPCRRSLLDFSGSGGTDYTLYDGIDSWSVCHAIMVIENGVMTEIARTKGAAIVFGAEDDAAAAGPSGVEGFTFVEFGAAVAVTDTGSVFFNAQTRDLPDTNATSCEINGILDGYGYNRHGVFMYRDGVVEKVIAEGDVISLAGQEAFVKGISLPQPELRAAVSGDSIMLKMAVDTDGDCIEDTVGLVQATAPSSPSLNGDDPILYTPDKGQYSAVVHPNAGTVRLVNSNPDNGWRLHNFRSLSRSDATYLSEEQMSGGLYSFSATWCKDESGRVLQAATRPEVCPADSESLRATAPTAPVELDLYLDVPVEDFLGVFKDLVDTPTLSELGNVEATDTGIKIALVIEDDSLFDMDADMGEVFDPFGAQILAALVIPPYVPVPALGQGLWVLLSGLVSLFGGVAVWRRRPA